MLKDKRISIIFCVDNESTDKEFVDIEEAFRFFQGYEYYTHEKKDTHPMTLNQFMNIVLKALNENDEIALYSDVDLHCHYYGCFYVKER